MKERKAFLLRMDPALYERLEAWAEQDMRSLNGQIEFILRNAVAKHRKALDSDDAKPARRTDERADS